VRGLTGLKLQQWLATAAIINALKFTALKIKTEIKMSDQANTEEKLSQIVSRAASDETLKNRLLNDTTNLLAEHGVEIPAGTVAHAALDNNSITLRFDPQTSADGTEELTESALASAVGGLVFTFKLVAVKTISWSA